MLKKLKLPKIKNLAVLFSYKFVYGFIAFLAIGTCIFLGLFIYKNYYQTIAQAEEIVLLREKVAPEYINVQEVNRVLDLLTKKTAADGAIEWEKIRNPFIAATLSPEPETKMETPASEN